MSEQKGTLYLKHTQIIIHWTDGRQETVRLGDVTRIGRGKSGNDIAVPEVFQSISRRHLEIRRENDGYRLLDLGSRNGVLINGVYVKDTYLSDGDEIRIGQDDQGHDIRIEFQLGSESFLAGLKAEEQVTIPPSAGLASESPLNTPHFKVRWHNGRTNSFPILKDRIVIGRGPNADLRLPETLRFVSGQHVEVLNREAGFLIRDLNSTNGTLLNNQLLQPGQFYPLVHEAIIRFGDDEYGISVGFTFINAKSSTGSMDGFLQAAPATEVAKIKQVLIGRLPTCNLILDHAEVSRRHALIRQIEDKYFIEDLHSSNGTLVNDRPIKRAELYDGDLIQISNFLLLFQDGQLVPYQSNGVRLDVVGLSKDVKTKNGTRPLLDNINLSVLPREFVALVGGSRTGKSTLLKALLGIHRSQGRILLNGHDFYKEYENFRSQLGYVPNSAILHVTLTVETALDYAARLRLPANLTAEERRSRIEAVLETVSMNLPAIKNTRIANLSAEQHKRISIAAELLADPKLIYLDEITSGLDPGLEKKMMHTLRRIADEGRTVVLVTDATHNILQTDHIAFLSEGKLVYFGPSEETLKFFEVEDFADIYETVEYKGDEWRKIFEEKKPQQHKKYILDRQKSLAATPKRPLPRSHLSIIDYFHQLLVLTQRAFSLLASDPFKLSLMLLLLPVTAILQLILAKPDILTGNLAILANPVGMAKTMLESYIPFPYTNIFIFLIGLEAVFTGLFLPLHELVKERSIFRRERMVNLKASSYLLSKVLVYSVFAFIQVLLYLIIISFGVDIPKLGLYFNGSMELFITVYLTIMAGISFGLIISAISKSSEMAIYILGIALLLQFFFAGALFDLRGSLFEPLSNLSITRWSLTALGVTIDMNRIAGSTIICNNMPENSLDPNSALKTVCLNYPKARVDLPLDYGNAQLIGSWKVLVGMTFLFLGITWLLLRRADST